MKTSRTNRLASEKSPYLLQHAHNPVDWYPWGPQAFEAARREHKPILVSIGYSTCHWCHVMEKESFEDPKVGELMNASFINIKVDREELPDIDAVYMTAVQAMTGSGGWPLNVFLTPELKPFYGGTYFPPEPAHGRPSWTQLLERIREVWKEKQPELRKSADQLTDAIRKFTVIEPEAGALQSSLLGKCESHFAAEFDPEHGGFGGAPKFPRPAVLFFLLRRHAASGSAQPLEMVSHTLRKMARGGIYDQLGGGFARYSVDARWLIPHFEKMLYDNAQLAIALVETRQLAGDDFFAAVARETLQYVLRDMTHPDGGFYSAEDADSEGVEGKFYLWTKREIEQALGAEQAGVFNQFFGVTDGGNFHDPHAAEATKGANILHQVSSLPQIAEKLGKSEEQVAVSLEEGARKLLEIRDRRIRPHRDDKILTGWNGLMISAFARAASGLNDSSLAGPAIRAADFIRTRLCDENDKSRLFHRWREGESDRNVYHSDYAFLIQGLLDLFEATYEPRWVEWALQLAEAEAGLFYDGQDGGFFLTPPGKTDVLVRIKDDNDNAEPSGNSVAVWNLLRLHRLTGRPELLERAEKTLRLFAARLMQAPFAVPLMAAAYEYSRKAPSQIVIATGSPSAGAEFIAEARRRFLPFSTVILVHEGNRAVLEKLQPSIAALRPMDGRAAAYVCENFSCKLPVTEATRLAELLPLPTRP